MIIRNSMIPFTSFTNQTNELNTWYEELHQDVRNIVSHVSIPSPAPGVPHASITWNETGGRHWLPSNLNSHVAVANDLTTVATTGGSQQAFALSLADVVSMSGPGLAFPNHAQRSTGGQGNNNGWWLRTPGETGAAWGIGFSAIGTAGQLHASLTSGNGGGPVNNTSAFNGVRPALIIHQPTN